MIRLTNSLLTNLVSNKNIINLSCLCFVVLEGGSSSKRVIGKWTEPLSLNINEETQTSQRLVSSLLSFSVTTLTL